MKFWPFKIGYYIYAIRKYTKKKYVFERTHFRSYLTDYKFDENFGHVFGWHYIRSCAKIYFDKETVKDIINKAIKCDENSADSTVKITYHIGRKICLKCEEDENG